MTVASGQAGQWSTSGAGQRLSFAWRRCVPNSAGRGSPETPTLDVDGPAGRRRTAFGAHHGPPQVGETRNHRPPSGVRNSSRRKAAARAVLPAGHASRPPPASRRRRRRDFSSGHFSYLPTGQQIRLKARRARREQSKQQFITIITM
jgi:hypothetical protein